MATRNYRQAKRSREESRKKRQQEKMARKVSRGTATEPVPESGPIDPANKVAP
jgi:hypothetical protein